VETSATFCGTQRFFTVFTRACQWSLFWDVWIQFSKFHPISLITILILSSHIRLSFLNDSFPASFRTRNAVCIYLFFHACYMPCFLLFFLIYPDNIWQRITNYEAPHYAVSSSFLLRPRLKPKYSQHFVLHYPHTVFFLQCARKYLDIEIWLLYISS
jgi:hypothetical protein